MDIVQLTQMILDLNIFDGDTSKLANASNALATIALAAQSGKRWNIGVVTAGYSAAPTGGLLTVYEGGNPIFQVPITDAGPTPVLIYRRGAPGNAMSIVLSAGGSGITGYLNADAVALPKNK